MSFWALSDASDATTTGKEYDAGGGNFEPIPKGTSVLALVDDAGWKDVYQRSEQFVNVKWTILKPEAYAKRVIFQKLFVADDDPNTPKEKMAAKRDKHKKLLVAIDANGKGRLAKVASKPSTEDLALALIGVQAVITLGTYPDRDNPAKDGGNWVMSVRPKTAEVTEVASKVSAKRPVSPMVFDDDDDEDRIPF